MNIEMFFDQDTFTLTYVVFDSKSKDAVVIDPVLDYNPLGSKIDDTSYEKVKTFIKEKALNLHYVLETHAHADHLTSAQVFKNDFPEVRVGIGKNIVKVQETFKKIYNLKDCFLTDGSQFDLLLDEENPIYAGSIEIKTLFTPGHTPACASYIIGDSVFTGDALFMPDYGTGRCDFPAEVRKIYMIRLPISYMFFQIVRGFLLVMIIFLADEIWLMSLLLVKRRKRIFNLVVKL